jgi:microcin C transport system substrate-binding protein
MMQGKRRNNMRFIGFLLFLIGFSMPVMANGYGIAMHGDLKYPANFTHFEYVNPDAPKGGTYTYAAIGTFDTLNPFIIKGNSASGVGMIYQSLMTSSADEAFSQYGDIASSISVADDHKSATFTIRPNAKWHDGVAITADDVVWTFNTLVEQGRPQYRAYYADIANVVAVNPQTVRFEFVTDKNKELPLIVGQLTVLPKHYWTLDTNDFTKTTLEPPLGSGPYKIASVDVGKTIKYQRVENWWAADVPVNKGRYNFDEVIVQYYRDATVAVEALFAGDYDVREENIAKTWATGYDNEVVNSGEIVKHEILNQNPVGMQGFFMNNRRPVFADINVRRAMQLAFDYEWSNKQFAFGAYKRTNSYFENSELASRGVPMGRELEILNEYRDQLPPELFTTPFTNPVTDGNGNNRENLRRAMKILDDAGYVLGDDGIRVHKDTGTRLSFEIIETQSAFERWVLPMIKNLKRIGVEANFRVIDTSQYIDRLTQFDFDMTVHGVGQSLSPGNEQREYWHSSKADVPGSRNYMGIQNPVIDALVDDLINAPSRAELVYRARALDRVLLWGYHLIPQWHINTWRVAHWDKFGKPDTQAPYALGVMDTWWVKDVQ